MKNRALAAAVLFLILATGLRARHLDTQSIWFDEGIAWHTTMQPTVQAALQADPTNPPLYYAFLYGWVRLAGDSAFALRTLPLLFGVLTLAVMSLAARRWFGQKAGLIALGLGSFMPLLWWAAQEARMYAMLALIVLITALGLMQILTSEKIAPRRAWLLALGGELAALYTHNTGIVVFGAINMLTGITWLVAAARGKRRWRLAGYWLLGQMLVVILWLPELITRFVNVSADNAATFAPPEVTLNLLWQSWQAVWGSSWKMMRLGDSLLHITAIVLLPLMTVPLFLLRRGRGRLLLGLLALLYVTLIAALVVLGVGLTARYLVMLAPLLGIAIAGGITTLPAASRWQHIVGIVAVMAAAAAWALLPGRADPLYQHERVETMVAYYADTLDDIDIVIAWTYAERYDLLYYWDRLGVRAQLVSLPEDAPAETVIQIINAHLEPAEPIQAELNTWYTQRADSRGMLLCLLEHRSQPPEETFTTFGMSSTRYTLTAPLTLPAQQPYTVHFTDFQITSAALPEAPFPADVGVCVPVTAQIDAPIPSDLRLALNVLNSFGDEIAGADVPVMTDGQLPTSRLASGTTATAYPLLTLPHGTPPGTYAISLRVYAAEAPDGFDVLSETTGTPLGKDAAAGTITLTPGAWADFPAGCNLRVSPTLTLTNCADLLSVPLRAGEPLTLTLHWQTQSAPISVTLRLDGDDWQTESTGALITTGAILDWHVLQVPAEAEGTAVLSVQAGSSPPVQVGQFPIISPERQTTAPETSYESGASFPGVGTLTGYNVRRTGADQITFQLVWQAETATAAPYTVSVQLLDANGALLAQHDSVPASGTRPTTSWTPGEYISDEHTIDVPDELVLETVQQIIVVMYDPQTNTRRQTTNGQDHIVLTNAVPLP